MRYVIDMAIFGVLPEFTRAVLVARDLDNAQNAAASRNMLQKAAQQARAAFAEQVPIEHAHLAPWQRAYEAFGITGTLDEEANELRSDGTSKQAIPTPLLFQIKATPLASVLNAFALQNLVPAGGDDLDKITGNVWLRPARATELFVPASHPERPETPDIGEIVYVDDGPHVLRRRWHGRPGDTARITPQTRNALIYLDCLAPVDRAMGEELADRLSKLVSGFFGAQVTTYFLTREQPALMIPD